MVNNENNWKRYDDDNPVDVNPASLEVFQAAGFILNCHDKDQLSLGHKLGGN